MADHIGDANKMVAGPIRIQLKRKRGWKMPPNTVKVARPGLYGNPFVITDERDAAAAVQAFRSWLTVDGCDAGMEWRKTVVLSSLPDLRGINLACWCPLDQPCHADVLLELANAPEVPR